MDHPEDIFTEPESSDDTLANLGPLRALAGIWTSADGLDVNPKAAGRARLKKIGAPMPNPRAVVRHGFPGAQLINPDSAPVRISGIFAIPVDSRCRTRIARRADRK